MANLLDALMQHVRAGRLGRVFGDGVSYELRTMPRTVRVPDASFVRADRLPSGGIGPGPIRVAPDLAIEVLSPTDRRAEVDERLADYATAGIPLVWIADPARRTVRVIAMGDPERWLTDSDVLSGGTVLPGVSMPVADVFVDIAPEPALRDEGTRPR